MNQQLPATISVAEIMETVLIKGDLSKLTAGERNNYYRAVCESVGLNPLTKPFEYITLNGKLRLYALKDCTDQLRSLHKISVTDMTESERDGVYIVKSKVQNNEGRTDMAIGAVNIANLKGEALANAMMKTETKSKRRATLSICGLGMLDETEIEDIPASQRRAVPSPAEVETVERHVPRPAPHHIVPEANDTFGIWTDRFLTAAATAQSSDELNQWDVLNKSPLSIMREKAPEIYKRLADKVALIRQKIQRDSISTGRVPSPSEVEDHGSDKYAPGDVVKTEGEVLPPKKDDPISTGRQKMPSKSGLPDIGDDYNGWFMGALGMIEKEQDPGALESFWNAEVESQKEMLFPTDYDELTVAYGKQQTKLNGDGE